MITNQAYLFLIFTLDGFIIGLLFDFFRILRRSFKTSDFVTYIEDILFWVLTGFLVLYSIFTFNNGEIRFFMFLGIAIGLILYMLLLSSRVIKINLYIIGLIKKVVTIIAKALIYPFTVIVKFIKKIFVKPITFLFINFKKLTKNIIKPFKRVAKNIKNISNKTKILKNNEKKEGI